MDVASKAMALDISRNPTRDLRDILVHVESSPLAEPRLDVAVSLARRFQATLIGVGAETVDPMVWADPYGFAGSELANSARQVVMDDLDRAQALFKAKTTDVQARWVALDALPGDALAQVARSADLIVAGGRKNASGDVYHYADVGKLVLTAGVPVLVAPPHGGRFRGDAVVVAWKDSREARRAVADSLPLLRAAEIVLVVEVCRKADAEDAEVRTNAVADHLRRHDIEVASKVVVSANDPAFEILGSARSIGADLIVTGGYGHSRLGEWVFGGVTRELLRQPECFLLMSH
jgi:nucleotide-binding universal stress UspA family protein